MTKFYLYNQNEPGGYVREPALSVIIEANTWSQANALATEYIYFDGINQGRYCECCCDRWDRLSGEDEGFTLDEALRKARETNHLRIYKEEFRQKVIDEAGCNIMVVYLDGRIEKLNN